jgi:hypothetical protein
MKPFQVIKKANKEVPEGPETFAINSLEISLKHV